VKQDNRRTVAALEEMTGPPIPYATPASYSPPPPQRETVIVAQKPSGFVFGFGCTFGVIAALIVIGFLILLITRVITTDSKPALTPTTSNPAPTPTTTPPQGSSAQATSDDKREEPTDAYGFTALQRAARDGNLQFASDLIAEGADVNRKSAAGWTPLQLAVRHGNDEMVKLLLAKGAQPDRTCIDLAKEYRRTSILKMLQAAPAK
jgi:hypothetical protein